MIGLRPILSDSAAEDDEERRADQQRRGDQEVGGGAVDLQRSASGRTARRTGPCTRPRPGRRSGRAARGARSSGSSTGRTTSVSGAFDVLPSAFILLEDRRLVQLQPDPDRDRRAARSRPGTECASPSRRTPPRPCAVRHAEDHQQRQEQAERRRGLDPAGVGAALAVRRVLGDVGRRAAVLAAERQALQQAQRDQDDRRGDADRSRSSAAGRR